MRVLCAVCVGVRVLALCDVACLMFVLVFCVVHVCGCVCAFVTTRMRVFRVWCIVWCFMVCVVFSLCIFVCGVCVLLLFVLSLNVRVLFQYCVMLSVVRLLVRYVSMCLHVCYECLCGV